MRQPYVQVIHCEAFTLEPNASRKIDVAFSPDFTLSKVQQTLELVTDEDIEGASLEYTLQATVPSNLLQPCSSTIPRPQWESLQFYIFFSMLLVMLVATVLMSVLDAHALLRSSAATAATLQVPLDREKVFDLRAIAVKESQLRTIAAKENQRNGAVAVNNGVPSQDLSLPRNQCNGKFASSSLNSSNNNNSFVNNDSYSRKPSSDSIKTISNVNGKTKSYKSSDCRVDSANCSNMNNSIESKIKESRKKSVNTRDDISIISYLRPVWQLPGRAVSGLMALFSRGGDSSQSSRLRKRHTSRRGSSGENKSKFTANCSVGNNNKRGSEDTSAAAADRTTDTKDVSSRTDSKHKSRYDKHELNDMEYQVKERNNGRFRRESTFSDSEYVANSYKSSHKLRQDEEEEEEEDSSSCSTESSPSEDMSVSDKVKILLITCLLELLMNTCLFYL